MQVLPPQGGGRCLRLVLLAFVIWPLPTHPFRDGVPGGRVRCVWGGYHVEDVRKNGCLFAPSGKLRRSPRCDTKCRFASLGVELVGVWSLRGYRVPWTWWLLRPIHNVCCLELEVQIQSEAAFCHQLLCSDHSLVETDPRRQWWKLCIGTATQKRTRCCVSDRNNGLNFVRFACLSAILLFTIRKEQTGKNVCGPCQNKRRQMPQIYYGRYYVNKCGRKPPWSVFQCRYRVRLAATTRQMPWANLVFTTG